MSLEGTKILVGMTGGIACYKIPMLVRLLVKEASQVQVIMTESATKFVAPLTLETVSNRPVFAQMFPQGEFVATRHIELAQWPNLLVIAPATANFLGKAASGISDDLLTTVVCASEKTVLVAPAMNPGMWQNQVTRKNVEYLRQVGFRFIGPEEGEMACEQQGVGRMAEPESILAAIQALLASGKKKA